MRILLKAFKWAGIVLGGLVGLIIVAMVVVYFIAGGRMNETYDIQVAQIAVPTDEAGVERGRHLVQTIGLCVECHGDNLEGKILEDDPVFGTFAPTNLTSGKGGIGGSYSDADFVRAIRHGVGPDLKPLIIMPSEFFNKFSDDDLGAIIAYLKSVPPVDNEQPESTLRVLGRVILLFEPDFLPATSIDHTAPRPPSPDPGVTREYGEYLATICMVCHGKNLAGGTVLGKGPEAPKAPNLTPAGVLAAYSEDGFKATIRTGSTPTGRPLDKEFMPWNRFKDLTDDELSAIWLFLSTVPPVEIE